MAPHSRLEELEAELAQLKYENTTMENRNATLEDENTKLNKTMADMQQQFTQQTGEFRHISQSSDNP